MKKGSAKAVFNSEVLGDSAMEKKYQAEEVELDEKKSDYEDQIKAYLAKGGKIQKGDKPNKRKIDMVTKGFMKKYGAMKEIQESQSLTSTETKSPKPNVKRRINQKRKPITNTSRDIVFSKKRSSI